MSEANAPHPPIHIVLIDDDPAVLHSLSFTLRLDGFEVSAYADAAAFLAAPQPQPWACAIIDQDMPGITGLDVAAALRERGSTLPLIMMSGGAMPWLKKRALDAGFLAVVEKPLFGDELGIAVAQALTLHASRRDLPPA